MKNLFTKKYWAMKGLALLVLVVMGGGEVMGQVTIASDGLNNSTTLFTLTGGLYYTGTTSSSSDLPASSAYAFEGTHSRGIASGTASLTSSNINTTGYSSVQMTFRLASYSVGSAGNGADGGDIVTVEVSPNGGTDYYSTVRVLGNGNSRWSWSSGTGNASTAYDGNATSVDFISGAGNATTTGYSTVTISSLPATSNLKIRVTLLNDNSAERWLLDDFNVTGNISCTSPTTQTTSLTTNTITTTTSNYAFTRGNGDNVLVVARLNGTSSVAPTSGTTYTPSTIGSFTGTTTTGTGNIVVYNGTAAGVSTATGNLNLTNLTAGSYYTLTAYEYATTGTCYNTTSPASFNFYTLCDSATSTTPVTIGSKSFTATWGAVTGASSYKLDVSTDNGFSSFVSGYNDLTVASTSQTVTGLSYNTTYYFRVRAINAFSAASANSNISSTTTKTAATSLVLVSVPTTGSVATNLTSFTVEARRLDASVDDAYTTNISISKASGAGTISGNGAVAAVSGIATFSAIQFDATGTYTITASDGTLTSSASSDIIISYTNSTVNSWINSSNATTWCTATNWITSTTLPSGSEVVQFNNSGSSIQAGITFSNCVPSILGIEMTSSRIRALSIGSQASTAGTLTLTGGNINNLPNVILRNASTNDLILQPNNTNTGAMTLTIGNTNDNVVSIDGSGNINISCIIIGNSKKITKAGSGTGVLTLTGSNTYTGLTTVSGGTLRLNKSGGTTIPATNSVTVSGGTLQISSDQTLANLTLTSGSVIIDAGITLTITGTISRTSGVIKGSSTSNLIITGTSGTIAFDQTTPGTTNVLKNLTISGSGTTTLGNTLNITSGTTAGTVSVATGATLATGGNLILKSDVNGTASIANSAGTITGNITVERYIPALRKFRFLAAPVVGATAANWRNNGTNTVGIGTQITGTGGATNNFDVSTTNAASAFSYNELLAGSDVTVGSGATSDPGWTAFADGNSEALTNGKGFRILVRGDRTISLDGSGSTTPTITTLSVTGTYPANSVSIATTKTNSNTNSGFNLVGNPYPATIDWNLVTKGTDISATYTIYDPTSNSYKSWNGFSGAASQYIASSQAFFVQQTGATGGITIAEANKVSNAAGNFFRNKLTDHLKISMKYDSANYDAAFIHFREDAQNDFDTYDGLKFQNAGVNIASVGTDGKRYNINSLASLTETTEIPLSVLGSALTNFELKFEDVSSFHNHKVYMIDHYLNKMLLLSDGFTYPIALSSDSASVKDGRFKIVFVQKATGINPNEKISNAFILYPNPAANTIHLLLDAKNTNNENVSFEIFNQLGARLQQGRLDFTTAKDQTIAIDQLAQGSYFIKLQSNSNQQTIKFIK